ncbi:MAG: 2-phosphosulfolactate phosphatase [candidate division WOR-3 bacterium]|nr:MAG: 2-phosphosulfolactate phosphatase [candidate division WOR-3 bacterium]
MERLRNKPAVPLVKLDWNIEGVGNALKNRDIVVIVDTLRFSSAVVTAVAHGFTIYPVADQKAGRDLARSVGAYQAGKPGKAKYTISPHSFLRAGKDDVRKVVLFSPNGATCAASVKDEDLVYIGCMLNARAVGLHVSALADTIDRNVTLIAAGEQRAIDTGERVVYDKMAAHNVFAIEDYLACGAIITNTELEKNAEAKFCELAYRSAKREIKGLMLGGFSGRYLVQHNMREDVDFAAKLNVYDVIPVVRNGRIEALSDWRD